MVRTTMMGAMVLPMVLAAPAAGAASRTVTASAAPTSTVTPRTSVVPALTSTSTQESDAKSDEARYQNALDTALAHLLAREFSQAAQVLQDALQTHPTFAERDPDIFCGLGGSRYDQSQGFKDTDTQKWSLLQLAVDAYRRCMMVLENSGGDSGRLARIRTRHAVLTAQIDARRQQLAAAIAARAAPAAQSATVARTGTGSVAVATTRATTGSVARAVAPVPDGGDAEEQCRLLVNAAIQYHRQGEYELSYPAFKRAEQCAPDEVNVFFGIGYATQVLAAHEGEWPDRLRRLEEAKGYFTRYVASPRQKKLVARAKFYLTQLNEKLAEARREVAALPTATTSTQTAAFAAQVASIIAADVRGSVEGTPAPTTPKAPAAVGPAKVIMIPGGTPPRGAPLARTATRAVVAAAVPSAHAATRAVPASQPSDWKPAHRQRYDTALELAANGDVSAAIEELHALRPLRRDDVGLRDKIVAWSAAEKYECKRALLAYHEIAEIAVHSPHAMSYGTYLTAVECAEQVGEQATIGVMEVYVAVVGERVDPAMFALLGDLCFRSGNVPKATQYYGEYLRRDPSPQAVASVSAAFAAYSALTTPPSRRAAPPPRPPASVTVASPPPSAQAPPEVAMAVSTALAVAPSGCWVSLSDHAHLRFVPRGQPGCP